MKYALIAAVVLLGLAAACSGSANNAVHITVARAPGSACTFSDPTIYKERGSLDLSALSVLGVTGYAQTFGWENTLAATSTQVNGSTVTDPSQNTFYAHQAVMTYRSSDSSVSVPSATWDMSSSLAAGATSLSNTVSVELLPASVPAALDKQITVGMAPITLDVTFQIFGDVGGHRESSAPFTFPLVIQKSGVTSCNPPYYLPGECGVLGKDAPVRCSGSTDAGVRFP